MTNINNLTPAEIERLALLVEEAAEVIQVVGKILRHGYEDTNPVDSSGRTNRQLLESELGDLLFMFMMLEHNDDIDSLKVEAEINNKAARIDKWLHHQDINWFTSL